MRRRPTRLAIILGILALLCGALVAGAAAKSIFVEVGGLKTSFGATVSPRALPRSKRAAIGVVLSSRIKGDGVTHIPAIRQATIAIDRSVAIDTRGIPACTAGELENQTSEGAEAACAAAVLGSGSARLEIAAPESAPFQAQSRLLAFNGGSVRGTTTILLHAYLTVPAPEAIVIPIEIAKLPKGAFGLRAAVRVPSIAGGAGSLAAFDLKLRRQVATAAAGGTATCWPGAPTATSSSNRASLRRRQRGERIARPRLHAEGRPPGRQVTPQPAARPASKPSR